MVAVPFPVTSAPGARRQESAGRLINAYAVKTEQGAPTPLKWTRSPGLRALMTVPGQAGFRGFLEINGNLLAVMNGRVVLVTRAGELYSATDLGALSGTLPVTIAKNNAMPPNIVAVSENGAFNLFTGAPPTNFADADLPQPNSVCVLNGYFVWTTADGRIFASDLNSLSVSSLSFTMAQQRSDGLLRGVAFGGYFYAFGPSSCEIYRDAGLSPFPLEYVSMIPRGLAGAHAVAGAEEGWSNQLVWAADDDVVYRLSGTIPEPVSTQDVSRAIAATPDKSVLRASVHMAGGFAFWCLTRPGHWSWELNLRSGTWNERRSYGAESWRAACTVKAFGQWIAGDAASGKLFASDAETFREGDDALVFEVVSGAVLAAPERLAIARLDLAMTAAAGRAAGDDPIETDPQVEISWSLDGGYRWSTPVWRAIGREGESARTITVNRLGLTGPKGIRIKLRVSDPVHVTLHGAELTLIEKRA